MQRVGSNRNPAVDKFGAGKNGFTAGDPQTGVQATTPGAELFDALQEEIARTIEGAGIALDPAKYDQLLTAIKLLTRQDAAAYAAATGTANAVSVDYTPAITAVSDGMVLRFAAVHDNTGAVTFSPNELPAKPVRGLAALPLQGGEIVAGGRCLVMYSQALDAWLLLASTGGALQVPDAVHPDQAPTLRQVEEIAGQSGGYLLEVKWWQGTRAGIPAGYGPNDGQLQNRATYPDVWAMINAGTVPVVSDAEWLADPTKRGCYSTGDGATTFRLPDYNGKYAGSLGAVFLRGDGTMSAAVAGAIQPDAMQGHWHEQYYQVGVSAQGSAGALSGVGATNATQNVNSNAIQQPKSDGTNGTPRTAAETRPLNVTGCWIVKLFGAVTNPGALDAAQLASDLVALTARVSILESQNELFVSSQQVITAGGSVNIAHPLGVIPRVWAEIVCQTAEHGYSVGDVVKIGFFDYGGSGLNYGVGMSPTTSVLAVRYGAQGIIAPVKSTGVGVQLTAANWRLVLRAKR